MYTKKVDDLQNAKKADESKIARNHEKLEEAKNQDSYDEIPESIREAWTKANSMRAWEHKTFDQLQRDLKTTVTEEFKK